MEQLVEWKCKEKNSALPKCINEWGDVVPLEDICAQLATIYDILGDCDLDHLRKLVEADKAQEECTKKGVVLPCPCCGGREVDIMHACGDYWCECVKCGAAGGPHVDRSVAIAKWNRRRVSPTVCNHACEIHDSFCSNNRKPVAKQLKIYDNPYTGKLMTTCSRCNGKVGPKDVFCKHCGALFVDN